MYKQKSNLKKDFFAGENVFGDGFIKTESNKVTIFKCGVGSSYEGRFLG